MHTAYKKVIYETLLCNKRQGLLSIMNNLQKKVTASFGSSIRVSWEADRVERWPLASESRSRALDSFTLGNGAGALRHSFLTRRERFVVVVVVVVFYNLRTAVATRTFSRSIKETGVSGTTSAKTMADIQHGTHILFQMKNF